MTGPKRSKAERERDLVTVARGYLRGQTAYALAASLGISRRQVGYDLRVLLRRWQREALVDFKLARALELARIDHLERVYWEEWELSRRERESSLTERVTGDRGSRDKVQTKREQRNGDPRYLEGVRWCIERRCKLLGLDELPDVESLVPLPSSSSAGRRRPSPSSRGLRCAKRTLAVPERPQGRAKPALGEERC